MAVKKVNTNNLQEQAYLPVIKIAGSILVLSVALKNIGIDFTPVMQAWTTTIAQSVHTGDSGDSGELMDKLNQIENRLIIVEKLAHEQSNK